MLIYRLATLCWRTVVFWVPRKPASRLDKAVIGQQGAIQRHAFAPVGAALMVAARVAPPRHAMVWANRIVSPRAVIGLLANAMNSLAMAAKLCSALMALPRGLLCPLVIIRHPSSAADLSERGAKTILHLILTTPL